ncbi:hypothetical protein OF83DRAFT_51329 [Amylostereum chailletii]|nr:hypothetical protein OF83DRAFT_51329 [Amylostereum chailletii]
MRLASPPNGEPQQIEIRKKITIKDGSGDPTAYIYAASGPPHPSPALSTYSSSPRATMTAMSTVRTLVLEGDGAFKAKNYELAITKYTAALGQDPTCLAARHGRGASYVRRRRYDRALEDAEQCIRSHPTAACGYALKGLALCREQHYARALGSYEVALEIEDNPEIEQIVEGIKALQKAKMGPGFPTEGRLMKTTKSGRPFCKDLYDLFAILLVSLRLTTYKAMFRVHEHAFTHPDALSKLASLTLCQSRRAPDPTDPSRFITESTTMAFALAPAAAAGMCAHFVDARLVENAMSPGARGFAERGVFVPTPKGLHVLGQFVARNGVDAEHLRPVFAARPVCPALVHLARRPADDELVAAPAAVHALFRRFAGRRPNWRVREKRSAGAAQAYQARCRGVSLVELTEALGAGARPVPYCFEARTGVDWLCDFAAVCGREEAGELAAHLVRLGLVRLVYDSAERKSKGVVYVVEGARAGEDALRSSTLPTTEFRCTRDAVYQITMAGRRLAGWSDDDPSPSSTPPSSAHTRAARPPLTPLETPAPRTRSPFSLLSPLTITSPRVRPPPSPSRPSPPSSGSPPIAVPPEAMQSPTRADTNDALAFVTSPTSLAARFPPFDIALPSAFSPSTAAFSHSALTLIERATAHPGPDSDASPDPALAARLRTLIAALGARPARCGACGAWGGDGGGVGACSLCGFLGIFIALYVCVYVLFFVYDRMHRSVVQLSELPPSEV